MNLSVCLDALYGVCGKFDAGAFGGSGTLYRIPSALSGHGMISAVGPKLLGLLRGLSIWAKFGVNCEGGILYPVTKSGLEDLSYKGHGVDSAVWLGNVSNDDDGKGVI